MTERPLLLLDVDGVLNPLRRPSRDFQTHDCPVDGTLYRVHLNPKHGAELLLLAEEAGAELVWATTWEHAANEWIGPRIGLPELPVIEMPIIGGRLAGPAGEMFKTPHVAAYVAGRPFVWFDDLTGDADEDYLRRHPGVGDFLLVRVDPRHGLLPQDLALAREWLTAAGKGS
ncbi:HAD domain-containing protein [Thermostaphylospora chromogena]|uniref:HAD domain-containing protein n=1 Tax=Thermostaphylospora chromogena TaxID=35622 RepID=UPI000B872504|nr:HAD domain-containing protein [Thermostaphylospora chromogena]